jgi:hypothetical protein
MPAYASDEDYDDLSDLSDALNIEGADSVFNYQLADVDAAMEDEAARQQQQVGALKKHAPNPAVAAAVLYYHANKMRKMRMLACIVSNAALAVRGYIKCAGGINKMRRLPIPEVCFDLDAMDDTEAQFYFRFDKEEIRRVVAALGIPRVIKSHERDKAPGIVVFCMMCARFAPPYPSPFSLLPQPSSGLRGQQG